jgi:hypothetical protein
MINFFKKPWTLIAIFLIACLSPVIIVTVQYAFASHAHDIAVAENETTRQAIEKELLKEKETPDHYKDSGLQRQSILKDKLINNYFEYETIQFKWLSWESHLWGSNEK